jgi:hypothetical protein
MSYKRCPTFGCMHELDYQAKQAWKKKGCPDQFIIKCDKCKSKIKVNVTIKPVFNYEA